MRKLTLDHFRKGDRETFEFLRKKVIRFPRRTRARHRKSDLKILQIFFEVRNLSFNPDPNVITPEVCVEAKWAPIANFWPVLQQAAKLNFSYGQTGFVQTTAFAGAVFDCLMDHYFYEAADLGKTEAFHLFQNRVRAGFQLRKKFIEYNYTHDFRDRLGLRKFTRDVEKYTKVHGAYNGNLGHFTLLAVRVCGRRSCSQDKVNLNRLSTALRKSHSMIEFLQKFIDDSDQESKMAIAS